MCNLRCAGVQACSHYYEYGYRNHMLTRTLCRLLCVLLVILLLEAYDYHDRPNIATYRAVGTVNTRTAHQLHTSMPAADTPSGTLGGLSGREFTRGRSRENIALF